jgi:hypothetical protein
LIAGIAVVLAMATPSREALIERWLRANRAHSIAALHAAPTQGASAPANLRALADRELATRGRYQLSKPIQTFNEPWWLRAWRWVLDRWQRFWNAIFGRVHVGKEQAASIGDVLLVAVGLLLIVVLIRLLRNLRIAGSQARMRAEPLTESPTPRALYKQACEAASDGDYGGAALLLFAATVALLDRQGAIHLTSSATVGDLRRTLRARNASLVDVFDTVAAPFVQQAYAERPVNESQWDRARAAFLALP